ncbi:MAG: Gfo/Idh/MocA family oxidoreductase [Deltaproteobacteria bacterium]|nr:Gfo/Idh/MocA family oxidoreductase [Deltaproteobacteria bacterium]
MKKNCLVIGFGSIGIRHARVLENMGFNVNVVSKRKVKDYNSFLNIKQALRSLKYHHAVICRPTSDHFKAALKLKNYGFEGSLLIEKPLFEKKGYPSLKALNIFAGYNLRFHPVLKKIYQTIQGVSLYSMHVYCGQHLSLWRGKRDYRTTYSASRQAGGGVLKDLSHELDYICWLTGQWEKVAAKGGRVSDLEIDSDDLFCLLLETKTCPMVSLQINYFDLNAKREIIINGEDLSIKGDLISGTLDINGVKKVYKLEKDATYIDEHEDILSSGTGFACTYDEGLEVLSLIEAAQKASEGDVWIKRS